MATASPHRGHTAFPAAGASGSTNAWLQYGQETRRDMLTSNQSPPIAMGGLDIHSANPCCLRWYGPSKSMVDLKRSWRPSPACGFTLAKSASSSALSNGLYSRPNLWFCLGYFIESMPESTSATYCY